MNNESEAKLRPFDAAKCKPGDPVVSVDGEQGRFIAYVPDARLDSVALIKWAAAPTSIAYTSDGRFTVGSSVAVFLPPLDPLDEVDPSPGNVDKLTRRQVGVGYRIVSHDEERDARAEYWHLANEKWVAGTTYLYPYGGYNTYRVPVAPAMVPLEQSDIILGRTVVRRDDGGGIYLVTAALPTALCMGGERPLFVSWDRLQRESWEISFDHGVTWQKAEKKGGVK